MAKGSSAGEIGTDDLVQSNLGFVLKIACSYKNLGLPFEDLVNEGVVGLLEAASRFDPSKGFKFTTYSVWWIRKAMIRALCLQANMVHIPEHRNWQARAIKKTWAAMSRQMGREAGREEVSMALRLTVEQMDAILQGTTKDLSLDARADRAEGASMLDRLVDERSVDPEERAIRRDNQRLIRFALMSLSEQERTIIAGRFGLAGVPVSTLEELGTRLGMSRERVRQIEEAAKKKLRKTIARSERGRASQSLPYPKGPQGRSPMRQSYPRRRVFQGACLTTGS
jgi:RNA polymerase primary sigma factor